MVVKATSPRKGRGMGSALGIPLIPAPPWVKSSQCSMMMVTIRLNPRVAMAK